MNQPRRLRPVRSPRQMPVEELYFCAVCQVSVARAEIESGEARRTPRGRLFCAVCADATPDERARRRTELEDEFADDAPVPVAAPPEIVRPPAPRHAAPAPQRPAASAVPPPLPPLPAPSSPEDPILDLRVGELERSAFRLQARVRSLEERLDAVLRRLE